MKEVASTSNRPAPKTILQSFAKTPISAPPKSTKQMKQTDEPTAALSDDGEPDDTDILSSKSSLALHSKAKSRKDREDALRRMMEEQEEKEEEEEEEEEGNKREVIEFASNMEADENPESESLTDAEPESGIPLTAQADKEPSETISNSGNGRRRGKRRVLKKKRILDDQGYMVTIQEPGWESFSEDDITPPAKKPTPPLMPSSSMKAKKTSTKGSQGSIMSFFAKK
ncbi:DNA polymerase subunit Cdc27 [Metarhizium robertsii ARSEF 23]|nr:DNA polymerase subunit Cdc27 [Metarhizium robertsii ARSEF 23]EFZ01495.2 DNA polymerase subunit Cdc27 [Metarhizium robertsii ARSEF 23]